MSSPVLLFILAALTTPMPSTAEIPGIAWEQAEVVDSPVSEVSSTSGSSISYWQGSWHVVYAKSGEIYRRVRTGTGWLAPEALTANPADSRNPHVAASSSHLHVVWEDNRSGLYEIYTRRWNGTSWSAELCLTCDGIPSRSPVIDSDGYTVFVAWEESSSIWARAFTNGSWRTAQAVSGVTGIAAEPSVAAHPFSETFTFVWTDRRDGAAEIYGRRYEGGGWSAEERLTEHGAETMHPSAHAEWCCGDVASPQAFVVYESDYEGAAEIYGMCVESFGHWGFRLSPADGIPSGHPNASGFLFPISDCTWWGGQQTNNFLTWTDDPPTGANANELMRSRGCGGNTEREVVSPQGLADAAVCTAEGNPEAPILVAWVEDVAGTPTLIAKRGSQTGCYRVGAGASPRSLLIAPGGVPANSLRLIDECTGNPAPGYPVTLDFDASLANDLTWDAPFGIPPFEGQSDDHGMVGFPLHGGGCSQAGTARAFCGPIDVLASWAGVKSPDIDGDCVVDDVDRAYVQSKLGTADFCADLDGSAIVDALDLAIVDATLGDICAQIVHAPDAGNPAFGSSGLSVAPNPAPGRVVIRIDSPGAETAQIVVTDAGGRRIREWRVRAEAGRYTVDWDGVDDNDREVPAGVYFAAARTGAWRAKAAILILR